MSVGTHPTTGEPVPRRATSAWRRRYGSAFPHPTPVYSPIADVRAYIKVFDVDDPFDQIHGALGSNDVANVGLIDNDTDGDDNRGGSAPAASYYYRETDERGQFLRSDDRTVQEFYAMVRQWLRVVVILTAIISLAPYARGDEKVPSVVSLRILSCAPTVIKPCQRATVLMEIRLEREATPEGWRRIVRRLSKTVHVNGVPYHNRLSSSSTLNDVCGFGLVSNSGAAEPTAIREHVATISRLVVGSLFANLRERECLFLEPGDYEIEFSIDNQTATTAIFVEEPAQEEAEIVEFLNDVKVLLLMYDPAEIRRAPHEIASELRRLTKIDSSYSKMLSLVVGIGGVTLRPLGDKPSKDEFRQRGSAWAREVYGLLNPYCSGEITSPIEALGMYKCGLAAGMLASDESDARKAAEYLRRRDEIWGRVELSPMTFGEAADVSIALKAIRREKAAQGE